MSRTQARRAALLVAFALGGCKTRYIQTAQGHTEGGTAGSGGMAGAASVADAETPPPTPCGTAFAKLASRLTVTSIELPAEIRYRRSGYNRIAEDDRIAFSIGSDGLGRVAWVEAGADRVHVTSLDDMLGRDGNDVVVDGSDVGGVVARPDGTAVLVTRKDPGTPLADPADPKRTVGRAAVLVKINQAGAEGWRAPLTGTSSVVASTVGAARDCIASPLNGRLEWDGSKYGAYFAVHGCEGDTHASRYGDKLVYLDDMGRPVTGGWAWNCSIDEGLRLLPGSNGTSFTPICLSDNEPAQGLNLVIEGLQSVLLAPEISATGYTGGALGSIVQMGTGTYAIGWLSRGESSSRGAAPDIAFLTLSPERQVMGPVTWVTNTLDVAELGLHLAPYGPDRLFASWEEYGDLECNGQTCDGTFKGTYACLMSPTGGCTKPKEIISPTPNELEDIRLFPARDMTRPFERDLGFAYVDVANRDRAAFRTLPDGGVPAPPVSTLKVARLVYCKE